MKIQVSPRAVDWSPPKRQTYNLYFHFEIQIIFKNCTTYVRDRIHDLGFNGSKLKKMYFSQYCHSTLCWMREKKFTWQSNAFRVDRQKWGLSTKPNGQNYRHWKPVRPRGVDYLRVCLPTIAPPHVSYRSEDRRSTRDRLFIDRSSRRNATLSCTHEPSLRRASRHIFSRVLTTEPSHFYFHRLSHPRRSGAIELVS